MRARWTDKVWYAWLEGKEVGPMSAAALRATPGVTPETFVRKEGEKNWKPLREVAELKGLFEDSRPYQAKPALPKERIESDELTADMSQDPPPFLLWFLAVLIVLVYTCILILWQQQ